MQHKPELYLLFWGNDFWNGTQPFYEGVSLYTEYKGFYEDLAKEQEAPGENSWQGILSQYYGESGSFGNAHVVGELQETAINAPQNMTKENILREITSWVNHGLKQNANTQVIVLAAPGTAYAEDPEKGCGYHGIDEQGYSYSFVAYAGDLNRYFNREKLPYTCNFREGDGEAETTQLMWSSTAVGSHEYAEEVTDPGLNGKYAWFSSSGEEIGDLCNHKPINSVELPAKNGRPGWWYVTELFDDEGGNTCKLEDPPAAPVPSPTATTGAPTNIQYRQATLNGSVNPNGPEGHYQFEYGTTVGYGSVTGEGAFPYGTTSVGESATVALKPGTTYHYRLRASTWAGTSYGADKEFTTPIPPPLATTESANEIGERQATLNATVNPEEFSTTYQFEYWPLGKPTEITKIPSSPQSVGSGASNVHVSQRLETLTAVSEYGYRVVASSAGGTTSGKESTFRTAPFAVTHPSVNPSGAEWSGVSGMSCNSATACMAVGSTGASKKAVPLAESWNGSEWKLASPSLPTGAKEATLEGVSCTSATACTAVGKDTSTEGNLFVLGRSEAFVERWNGSAWSAQPTPSAPSKHSYELHGISCTGSTACIAIGATVTETVESVPLAESWNGSEWKVVAAAGTTGVLDGISCSASTACTAVGSTTLVAGEPMIERWNGSEWKTQEPAKITGGATLTSVSCVSSTSCITVGYHGGYYLNSPPASNVSETWNGTAWSIVAVPAPVGAAESALRGISCASATLCIAVGLEGEVIGKHSALADLWNGSEWRIMSVITPTGTKTSVLSSVSCTTTLCSSGGSDEASNGQEATLVAVSGNPFVQTETASSVQAGTATLNGTIEPNGRNTTYHFEYGTTEAYGTNMPATEAAVKVLSGSEHVSTTLTGLNPQTTYHYRIVATNPSGTTVGADKTFTTTTPPWTTDSTPSPSGAEFVDTNGASCTSTTACMAVGSAFVSKANVPLAESWNGSEWKLVSPSLPTGAKEATLEAVSCTSATACTAVGKDTSTEGKLFSEGGFEALVERWNGSTWSVQSTPAAPAKDAYELRGVSCTGATACIAVGANVTGTLASVPLSERWNGTEWTVVSAPGSSGLLQGISCSSSTACTAVGSTGFAGNPMIDRWNGNEWKTEEPAKITGGAALTSVSCASSTSCVTVGYHGGYAFGPPASNISETWNGTTWATASVPLPPGAKESTLRGVSCGTTTWCFAVGLEGEVIGKHSALTDQWNGKEWQITTLPLPTGTTEWRGISCAAVYCTVSGNTETKVLIDTN